MAKNPTLKASTSAKPSAPSPKAAAGPSRAYLSQEDVPSCSLNEALRVGIALVDQYGGRAATPLDVAAALNVSPTSGGFRMLCGASIAYGVTTGGYNAQEISLTPLGNRILTPLDEDEDAVAKRDAVLKPRIIRDFLSKYSGAALPRDEIAQNVLKSLGVPLDRVKNVFELIIANGNEVGFFRKIKEKTYVDLGGTQPETTNKSASDSETQDRNASIAPSASTPDVAVAVTAPAEVIPSMEPAPVNRKVFITHGKNMAFIDPIKRLLGFGELVPVVSVEKQSVSQPVPDKVMNDMRACSAAIIHVDSELTLIDNEAKEHTVINPNVLIEIGAAMALFGRRFILLVRDGVKLPSNLQGLYEVRYQGDSLDGNETIKLLEAINDIKNNPLPSQNQ